MKRIACFDVFRALSILWIIVLWHTGIGYIIPFAYQITVITLAAFTFMSGFFMKNKKVQNINDYKIFLKSRFIRLWPLFFVTSIIMFFYGWYDSLAHMIISLLGCSSFYHVPTKTLWYISMIIFFYYITPIVTCQHTIKSKIFSCCVLWLVFYILGIFIFIDWRFLFYIIFYFIGLVLPDKYLLKLKTKIIIYILPLLFFCFFFHYNKGNFIVLFMVAILGILCLLYFSNYIVKYECILHFFYYVSQASMVAYLTHRIFFMYFYEIIDFFSIPKSLIIIFIPIIFLFSYKIQSLYNSLLREMAL